MPRSLTWPSVASDPCPAEHSWDARAQGSTAKVAIPGTTREDPCPSGSVLPFLVPEGTLKLINNNKHFGSSGPVGV